MIFFTRELYRGYQEKSGWTRAATVKTNPQLQTLPEVFPAYPTLPSGFSNQVLEA
jgi:hypothetical protein